MIHGTRGHFYEQSGLFWPVVWLCRVHARRTTLPATFPESKIARKFERGGDYNGFCREESAAILPMSRLRTHCERLMKTSLAGNRSHPTAGSRRRNHLENVSEAHKLEAMRSSDGTGRVVTHIALMKIGRASASGPAKSSVGEVVGYSTPCRAARAPASGLVR